MITFTISLQWYWLLLLSVYITWIGFLAYTALVNSWNRLKIGIKILTAPAMFVFGLLDMVVMNWFVGTILFLELPSRKFLTFSQRCSYHYLDAGFRGVIARAFAVPLNAVYANHIHS